VTDDRHQKQVDELIKHDRHITQKQIAGRLGMSKESVGYIIGLLGYTKICFRWVPRMLTPEKKRKEKKRKGVEICEELLKRYREDGDQLLGMSHGFIILTLKKKTEHAIQAHFISSPERIQNSAICRQDSFDCFFVFWDSQRVYMKEFLKAGNTVNSARYIETIKTYHGGCVELGGQHH
jgi:hypothetical protein